MHFAFHKYRGSHKALSIIGIDAEKVAELVCEAHDGIAAGHYTAYKVESVEWPQNVTPKDPSPPSEGRN